MKIQESLRALCEIVADRQTPEVHQALMNFLRLLVHDLNNPIGVFRLEIYSAQETMEELSKGISGGDADTMRAQVADLRSILENLDLAYGKVTSIINAVEQVRSEQIQLT